jgi:ElaB/YqjD/DUF883 family membrane-anchored ribosome-binding protein
MDKEGTPMEEKPNENVNESALREELDALRRENSRLKEKLGEINAGETVFNFGEIKKWFQTFWGRFKEPLGWAKEAAAPQIKERPIASVLVAFGVGFVLSRLISRR